jgi:hypothetical protein
VCVLPKANIGRVVCVAALAALLLVNAGDRALSDTGCLNDAAKLNQSEIDAFLSNPSELLERYPAGGPAMSARVQRLAASDMSTVHALIALAENAKPIHVVSLSMGLGRATAHCAAKRPDIAQAIRQLVASKGPPGLRALFSSEATVSELALGSPIQAGTSPAAGGSAQLPPNQPSPLSKETLDAIIKARPAGFLLPTNFGLLPGVESETRTVPTGRSGESTSPSGTDSASSTPAATSSGAGAVLPPTSGRGVPFAVFGTSESGNPQSGSGSGSDAGLPASLSAAETLRPSDSLRSSSDDNLGSSSEEVYSGYNDVVSPSR